MRTRIIIDEIPAASDVIRNGGLAAVPTETVYGLAGNGLDAQAVSKIYEVKVRPAVKPLSLMVPDASALERYGVEAPEQARLLADTYWPGPLTIVVKARPEIAPSVFRSTVSSKTAAGNAAFSSLIIGRQLCRSS